MRVRIMLGRVEALTPHSLHSYLTSTGIVLDSYVA